MSLNLINASKLIPGDPVVVLYRSMIKELPKVLSIYDLDIPLATAQKEIRLHFNKNSHVKDVRVRDLLVAKGYMELEETLMQWKQKAQLMRVFEGWELRHFKKSKVQPDNGLMGAMNAKEEYEAEGFGEKYHDQIVGDTPQTARFHSAENDQFISALGGHSAVFESQWKQWTNLTAPASDASFKETSEYLFKKQCHAYMSVREGLWTDFQTLIGDKKAAQRELSNDLQFDMDEELYSMLVEEFVKSPAFVDWYKMHSYHEPMGPLDEIIPAVVAGDKEVLARAAKDGIEEADAVTLILMEIEQKIIAAPTLAEHLIRRKIGGMVQDDLDQLVSHINVSRWENTSPTKESINTAKDLGFELPWVVEREVAAGKAKWAGSTFSNKEEFLALLQKFEPEFCATKAFKEQLKNEKFVMMIMNAKQEYYAAA